MSEQAPEAIVASPIVADGRIYVTSMEATYAIGKNAPSAKPGSSVTRALPADEAVPTAYYTVSGELFFASSNDLTTMFEYTDDPQRVVIDMSQSHVWDASTVAALDAITNKYQRHGKSVVLVGMNEASTSMHARLAGNLGGD